LTASVFCDDKKVRSAARKPIFRISTDYYRNWKEQIAPFARELARQRKYFT
jgi:hypothetical protein